MTPEPAVPPTHAETEVPAGAAAPPLLPPPPPPPQAAAAAAAAEGGVEAVGAGGLPAAAAADDDATAPETANGAAPPAAAAAAAGAAGNDPASPTSAAAAASAAAQPYGAAAVSLMDLACKPGTVQFAAAKAEVDSLLQKYKDRVAELAAGKQAKPDMVAYKQLRPQVIQRIYGHIPGCAVGDAFEGRGEMAILSLHNRMMTGIDSHKSATHGAYAICLSGGYKDDSDGGHTFWYTGVGGQGTTMRKRAKQQVADQEYSVQDNAALVQNYGTGTPVRVFRCSMQKRQDTNGKVRSLPLYVYEGLYQVVEHRRVPSQDGPLVCQFRMQGVPGHSVVSAKVEYTPGASTIGGGSTLAFRRVVLAGGAGSGGSGSGSGSRPTKVRQRTSPSYAFNFNIPSKEDIQRQIQERKASGKYGRLVSEDVSGGLEQVPIPVWNDVDADDTVPVGDDPTDHLVDGSDEGFTYLADYVYGEPAAKSQATRAEQHFRSYFPHMCGIKYHGGRSCYTDQGCLTSNESCGVMECDSECVTTNGSGSDSCKGNMVLQKGIVYPLEVFKCTGKGWGVRCAVDIPVGAVLCAYIGVVITDSTAEMLSGLDQYLFNLDHFQDMLADQQQQQQQQGPQQQQQQELRRRQQQASMPPPPPPRQQQQQASVPPPPPQSQQQQQASTQPQQPQQPPPPAQQQQQQSPAAPQQQQQQQQEASMPPPPPPPPPQQQQQRQQQQVGQKRKSLQRQPSRLGVNGSLGGNDTAAAAAAAAAGGAAANGSLSGRKRQKRQSDAGGGDAGLEGGCNPNLPPLHPELRGQHLVVDASHEGNVARFLNHSCDPNCLVQPILTKNARSHLLYYIAIVAQEDIPALTELTYNYHYQNHKQPQEVPQDDAAAAAGVASGADAAAAAGAGISKGAAAGQASPRVPCMCGAANCCKWLLLN